MLRQTDNRLSDIILNHPDVRPTVEQGDNAISVQNVMLDPRNVVMASDTTLAVFVNKAEGVYEGHIACLPAGRGSKGFADAKEALDRLFREFGAQAVHAAVPLRLREARILVRRLGFASRGISQEKPVEEFIMEAESWAA